MIVTDDTARAVLSWLEFLTDEAGNPAGFGVSVQTEPLNDTGLLVCCVDVDGIRSALALRAEIVDGRPVIRGGRFDGIAATVEILLREWLAQAPAKE